MFTSRVVAPCSWRYGRFVVWRPFSKMTFPHRDCKSLKRIELYDCQLITRGGIRRLKVCLIFTNARSCNVDDPTGHVTDFLLLKTSTS